MAVAMTRDDCHQAHLAMMEHLKEAQRLGAEITRGVMFREVDVFDELDPSGKAVSTVDAAGNVVRRRPATPEERTIAVPGT